MKRITLTLTVFFAFIFSATSQNSEKVKAEKYITMQGELTFTFQIERDSDLELLTHNMSLVNYDSATKTVTAWANEAQFRAFEEKNIPFNVPQDKNEVQEDLIYDVRPLALRSAASTLTFPLGSYPTYAEYAQQMQDFEDDYPALVEKISIGTTGQGDKELLFVKISDNVSVDEAEPKLMFTSSMHGDEIAGYPMMLTLIDYILTVYNNTGHADHARIKNLVENAEIWINPSANPDGTYHNSSNNTSVVQARRGNGNNIDLNRNYPDNVAGDHPDGEVYQTETIAFMNFADAHNFVIAANFHGGTELVNYPFDNAYATSQYTHADTDWYEFVSVEYATHCQTDANAGNTSTPTYNNKGSYMTDDDDWDASSGSQAWHNNYRQSPGVTHGAEWYRVYGGRQDYMNVYHQCRETTIELSDTKILPESSLVDYWYYNRDALLDYLTQGTYGFRGIVKDASTTNAIEGATITVVGHDAYGSEVSSDTNGDFYRPIKAGTYDLTISAPCYQSVTLNNQSISDYTIVDLSDILLTSVTSLVPSNLTASAIGSSSATLSWSSSASEHDLRYREVGAPSWTTTTVNGVTYDVTGLSPLTQYEAQVRSNCGSFNSAYSSLVLFTTTDTPNCTGTEITSYPYLETFDTGLGDWVQGSGDDGDWSLDANGTQSNNTGPSDDITGGGNYFYTEASTNGLGSNATVILESPCYNLTSLSNAYFSFYYHMYGTNVGTLNLEISNDDGQNWTNIFTVSNNVGDMWNLQNIDINSYIGQTVKLRFIGLTGNGWSSDIAIDHIGVGDPIYCASNGNSTARSFIDRVQLNTLDNNNSGVGTTSTGYSDFTAISTTLAKNTTYTITVTPDFPGASYNVGYRVWIDYNKDGIFTNDERVLNIAPSQNASVSSSFTVPASITTGNTRMRVGMKNNGRPSACETFNYGEVEDYTINLFNGLIYTNNTWTPNAPSDITSSEDVLVVDGMYNLNSSNISINNLTVNSGATIDVNKTSNITVAGDIINNGELILNSDSNEFSSLLVNGTVTGSVKYNRHVTSNAGGNDLISPPVSGESFTSFVANNSNILSNSSQTLYLFGPFEKPLNDYGLFSNVESAILDAANGYRAASTDNGTFTFTGDVTTNSLNVPIIKTGIDFAKWNLIGNPYTTYIKLEDFLAANLNELDAQSVAIYGYDADVSDGSVWTIWNMAYSDNNPGSLIAPGQGFFVSSKDGGSNVSFTPSMRTIGSTDDFIQGRSANLSHFVIKMSSPNKISKTDIYFKDNATLGLDIGYDAELFEEEPSTYSIYSELSEQSIPLNMAIQTIGFNDVNGSTLIPVGINLLQGQQVTISMDTEDLNYDVYLEDTLLNTITLLNTSDYNFTAEADMIGTGRFYLRFETETLSLVENSLDTIQVYNNSDLKQIVVKGQLTENTSIVLYDIQGRMIINSRLDSSKNVNSINVANYSKGVYLIQLENSVNTISKKIILR